MTRDLTAEQVAERVAILKRFRELLEKQRAKFREYLVVLEKQETVIGAEDVDAIVHHTELEQSIVSELSNIQKVIDPFERLYRDVHPEASETDIPALQTDLARLQAEVLEQNAKNRELLKSHMVTLRQKVMSLNNPYAKKTSVYASDAHTATRIDINS